MYFSHLFVFVSLSLPLKKLQSVIFTYLFICYLFSYGILLCFPYQFIIFFFDPSPVFLLTFVRHSRSLVSLLYMSPHLLYTFIWYFGMFFLRLFNLFLFSVFPLTCLSHSPSLLPFPWEASICPLYLSVPSLSFPHLSLYNLFSYLFSIFPLTSVSFTCFIRVVIYYFHVSLTCLFILVGSLTCFLSSVLSTCPPPACSHTCPLSEFHCTI